MKNKKIAYKKRWYDKHEGLSLTLERLRTADKRDCDNIVDKVREIVTKRDPDFIDKVCREFLLDCHARRWYDEDPYLWSVFNSLRYADGETIEQVVGFTDSRKIG
jgi:hypothetical protein